MLYYIVLSLTVCGAFWALTELVFLIKFVHLNVRLNKIFKKIKSREELSEKEKSLIFDGTIEDKKFKDLF